MDALINTGIIIIYLAIGFGVAVFLRTIDKNPKDSDDQYYLIVVFIWPLALVCDGVSAAMNGLKGATGKCAEAIKPGCTKKD